MLLTIIDLLAIAVVNVSFITIISTVITQYKRKVIQKELNKLRKSMEKDLGYDIDLTIVDEDGVKSSNKSLLDILEGKKKDPTGNIH